MAPRGPTRRPLEQGLPRSRAHAPLEQAPSRSRFPHERTCSDTAEPRHHSPGNHTPTLFRQLPRGSPSLPLWGVVRRGWCQLRDTVPPTLVRLTRRALEGGPVAPSSPPLITLQGQTVTSGRRERHLRRCQSCAAIPPLLRHAVHCYNYSDVVEHEGTGRRRACYCTPYGSPSTAPSNPPEGALVNHYASTLEVAPVQAQDAPQRHNRSKIRQDGRQLHGTVRHTTTRSEIGRHACKSPSPWPIKGR
jgi:hypothetical protein